MAVKQSTICQRYITVVSQDVIDIFSERKPGEPFPVVLIPSRKGKHFGFVTIPSGARCLISNGGRHIPLDHHGLAWKPNPLWRIAYVVCEQEVRYDCPVKKAATKDDVMVDFDFTVSIRITNAENFVFKIGAAKFDLFLRGAVEEAIRHLARQYTHQNILDLRGAACGTFLEELNEQAKPYGVMFSNAKITEVHLPGKIAQELESYTTITKEIETSQRVYEEQLQKLDYQLTREVQSIRDKNLRDLEAETSRKAAADTNGRKRLVEAEEQRAVARMKAEQAAATAIREASAALVSARFQQQKLVSDSIGRAKADLATAEAEFERHIQAAKTRADSIRTAAEAEAAAVRAEGAAEKQFSSQLAASRQVKIEEARIKASMLLATKSGMIMAGKSADSLVGHIISGVKAQ